MYVGLGQTAGAPPCSTLVEPPGTLGPFNCTGSQADVTFSDSTATDLSFVCPSGSVLVNGVCTPSSGFNFMAWLQTGNNALYVGGGVLGFLALMMAMRR